MDLYHPLAFRVTEYTPIIQIIHQVRLQIVDGFLLRFNLCHLKKYMCKWAWGLSKVKMEVDFLCACECFTRLVPFLKYDVHTPLIIYIERHLLIWHNSFEKVLHQNPPFMRSYIFKEKTTEMISKLLHDYTNFLTHHFPIQVLYTCHTAHDHSHHSMDTRKVLQSVFWNLFVHFLQIKLYPEISNYFILNYCNYSNQIKITECLPP